MKSFDSVWENVHKSGGWGKYPNEDVVRFMARNYYDSERSNVKILDLGCGGGSNTWNFAAEGFNTYAIDGSEVAVNRTVEYLKLLNLSANIEVSDATELPYEDNFFDVIIDCGLICTNKMDSIKSILNECHRILKVGGTLYSLYLFDINTTGYGTGERIEENSYRNLTCGPLINKGIIHFFNRNEINKIFTQARFSNITIDNNRRSENNETSAMSFFMVNAEKV